MSVRKVVTASVAALALAAVSPAIVNAQDDGAAAGALSAEGLVGGSLDSGSLSGASGESPEGAGSAGSGDADSGSAGSLESVGSEGEGLSSVIPETGEVCDLPGLGGSVAKFYPLFGITGIPTSVISLVTDALDSFPNLLELVAGENAGAAILGQTGSLNEGLCTAIFGGEMVMPPVTVIVDGDGNPITTVTGTVAPAPSVTTSTLPSSSEESVASSTTTGGTDAGGTDDSEPSVAESAPRSTTVPVG